jgi:hypothetical protein
MKTALISTLLFANTLFAVAQITLENTYAYSTSISEISENEYSYYLMDVAQNQCRLYNSSHELYKSISLSIPEGYYLSDIQFVTKNLFNTNDKIELLCIYEKYITNESGSYLQYGLAIVDEAGNSLLTLPNGGWAEIKQLDKDYKLLTYSYLYNPLGYYDVTTNVYTLGGTAENIDFAEDKVEMVYPNPAKDHIIVSPGILPESVGGQFTLFTISGQKVLSCPINTKEKFTFPINELPSGTYVYSVKNKNNLIQSNTLIIR